MQKKYCQSCAMPMENTDEMNGTNADGSKNTDYCTYCFKDGDFISDCSMDEMIEFCIPHMVSANPGMDKEEAKRGMEEFFPTLKRWNKN